jgi:DNA-binding transcriptional MocR family regulator
MPKTVSSFELTLKSRARHQTLTNWLYGELRSAILEGRLAPGARLPASRDFASQYELSRGTVVSVLERLQAEGYITSRVGFGTWVNRVEAPRPARLAARTPAYIRRVIRHINGRNPGSTRLSSTASAPFESEFQPSTNSLLKFGDALPRTGRVISGRG